MEDNKKFNELIRPYFIRKGLPSSDAFLTELSEEFIRATNLLVTFRKERALGSSTKTSDVTPSVTEREFVRKKGDYEPLEDTQKKFSSTSQRSNRHPRNERD